MARRSLLLLVFISLLVCGRADIKDGPFFAAGRHLPGGPAAQTCEDWAREAQQNQSLWRNNLFKQTLLVTKLFHEAQEGMVQPAAEGQHRVQHWIGKDADHPKAHAMYQLSDPFVACPPPGMLAKVGGHIMRGEEDGHKFLCNVDQLKEGCTVLSIGSNGDTSFEKAILASTPCTVHTLDCTLKKPLVTLGERHIFYPLCLGSADQAEKNSVFITLPQLMQMIGKDRADILKMDIEGFEWDVLAGMGTEPGSEAFLPQQMAIEFHTRTGGAYWQQNSSKNLLWPSHAATFTQLQMLMLHIVDMGYGIVSRDDNPLAHHCSELTFHRVSSTACSSQVSRYI